MPPPANPYQSPRLADDDRLETTADREISPAGPPLTPLSRRSMRVGRVLLIASFFGSLACCVYWVVEFPAAPKSTINAHIADHPAAISVFLWTVIIGISGAFLCSLTRRRERIYLYVTILLQILVVMLGYRIEEISRSGGFRSHLMPLIVAVLYSMWLIGQASLMGFWRVAAYRNRTPVSGHTCELTIGLLALAAGCFSAWSLTIRTAPEPTQFGLLCGSAAGLALSQMLAIWMMVRFPIDRS